jgi:hypothetical protein
MDGRCAPVDDIQPVVDSARKRLQIARASGNRPERRQQRVEVLAVLNLVPTDVFLRRGRNPSSVQ